MFYRGRGPLWTREEEDGPLAVSSSWLGAGGQRSPSPQPREAASVLGLTLSFLLLAGEQTKALVTQLTLFNRVLTELREDIRDQVRRWGGIGSPWAGFPKSTVPASTPHPPPTLCALLPRR